MIVQRFKASSHLRSNPPPSIVQRICHFSHTFRPSLQTIQPALLAQQHTRTQKRQHLCTQMPARRMPTTTPPRHERARYRSIRSPIRPAMSWNWPTSSMCTIAAPMWTIVARRPARRHRARRRATTQRRKRQSVRMGSILRISEVRVFVCLFLWEWGFGLFDTALVQQ